MTSFLYASIAGLLLAGTQAKPNFDHLLGGKQNEHKTTGGGKKVNKQSAHSSCSVSAYADAYSGARDGIAYAVADVSENVCRYGWRYDSAYDRMYDEAYAFASATAEVYVDCTSYATEDGYASSCGYGSASADAVARAYAEAYADATAEATNKGWYCCKNPEIWTSAHANLFQVITAKAWAKAEAAACTEAQGSYDRAWAYALVDCYASVWTQLWAEAYASIYIDAGCYGSDSAHADVDAWVKSFSVEYDKCEIKLKSSDGAGADGKGKSDADS